ncbi:MAG: hypothetical protein JNL90_20415 [Planctomycetes bacterium]|nr:hypothetical protein [Planctomycetota bacterium]
MSGRAEGASGDAPLKSAVATDGPVSAWLEIAPARPRLSDEPTLTLVIEAEPGVVVEPPPFGALIADFAIRGLRSPLPQRVDGREQQRHEYRLEPLSSGPRVILPIPIAWRDARDAAAPRHGVLETESLTVEVAALEGSGVPSLADLAVAEPPVPLPRPLPWPALSIGGGALLLALLAVVLVRRKKRRAPPPPTALELAERELAALLAADPDGSRDVKRFYVELTAIVRRHVERTTAVHAPEQTTAEFLRAIQGHPAFDRTQRERLAAFLEAADLVKFGGQRPGQPAIAASVARAREFLHAFAPPSSDASGAAR